MPITLSAANRLRNKVLSIPGTVLIMNPGYVDRVIRFEKLPDVLAEYKKVSRNPENAHITIDLGNGPSSEAWRDALDVVRRTARRDRPVPDPIAVAENVHEDWAIAEEDVPVIESSIEVVTQAETDKRGPGRPKKA